MYKLTKGVLINNTIKITLSNDIDSENIETKELIYTKGDSQSLHEFFAMVKNELGIWLNYYNQPAPVEEDVMKELIN